VIFEPVFLSESICRFFAEVVVAKNDFVETVTDGEGDGDGDFVGVAIGVGDLVTIGCSGVFSGGIELEGSGLGEAEAVGVSVAGGDGMGSPAIPPPPANPPPTLPLLDGGGEDATTVIGALGATLGAGVAPESPLPPPAVRVVISSEASDVDPVVLTAVIA
jgi:hypothetical protein